MTISFNSSLEDSFIIIDSAQKDVKNEGKDLSFAFSKNINRLQDLLNTSELKNASKYEIFLALKSLYGEDLIDRILRAPMFSKWPEKLDFTHLLKLLAMVGHFVTLNDMQNFWNEIRQDNSLLSFFKFDPLSSNVLDINKLSKKEFNLLLQIFRNPLTYLDLFNIDDSHIWDEIRQVYHSKVEDNRWMAFTRCSCEMEKIAQNKDQSKPEFSFASPEQIARAVAYAHPLSIKEGMVISVFRKELSETVFYKLEKRLNSKDGLHAYLFTPIGRNDLPAQLVFRGTNDGPSLLRDCETSGVGKETFDKHSMEIKKMVLDYAKESHNSKIEIVGHSLGGADAQRATELLLDEYVNNNERVIENIKLFAFCSPKLDLTTSNRWEKNIKTLASFGEPCHIELNFAEHTSDLVTWAGDKNLLGNANGNFISANYLIVSSPKGVISHPTMVKNNHSNPFFKSGTFDFSCGNRSFKLFQSGSYKDMNRRLQNLRGRRFEPVSGFGKDDWINFLSDEEYNKKLFAEEKKEKITLEKQVTILSSQAIAIEKEQKGVAQTSWVAYSASIFTFGLKTIVGIFGRFFFK